MLAETTKCGENRSSQLGTARRLVAMTYRGIRIKTQNSETAPNGGGANRPLNCVDLFAGAGGLSWAARELGFHVKAAVESDNHACDTYRRNLIRGKRVRVPKLYQEDISVLDPKTILDDVFSEQERCDLVLGGPPCQGFSVHRIGDAGKGDERNGLIMRYFDYVKVLRPRAFVMENVPGILWPRHQDFLDSFYEATESAGYETKDPEVLDARDYGVPQKRKRVFVIGIRKDVSFEGVWPPPSRHTNPRRAKELKLKPWRLASEVFRKISAGDPNNIHMNHSAPLVEVFRVTPKNGGSRSDSGRVLFCHESHDGHRDVYGRIDPKKPGPTMTTACINPSKGRFVHPKANHGITVRHAARFQTFPDDFVFEGGLMAAGVQVGNAVPVLLGKSVLRSVVDGLS